MKIAIEWLPKIDLGRKASFLRTVTELEIASLPTDAGLYVFARQHGRNLEPIYVGKATNLRARLKTQFNNFRLMNALANEKSGSRVLLLGTIHTLRGQRLASVLRVAERTHIEHSLTAGFPLINVQMTKGQTHSVTIAGKKPHTHPFPRAMLAKAT